MSEQDYYGIAANVISDRALRTGARVWILRNHFEHVYVTGLSKCGRRIRKFMQTKRIRNCRVAWVPPTIHEMLCGSENKERMQTELNGWRKMEPNNDRRRILQS